MYGDRSAPPLGRLIGNALQHWADHQRVFWLVAGFCGLLFGALRLAEMRGWLGSSSSQSTTFVFLVYVLFLYLAIHLALFDDPEQWLSLRRKPVPGRKTYPGFAFWLFCVAYGAAVFAISIYFFVRLDSGRPIRRDDIVIVFTMFVIESVVMLGVAVVFANFLLFLPAEVARYKLGLGNALRHAAGVRWRLVGLALFCTALSVISALVVSVPLSLKLPEPSLVAGLVRAFTIVIDLLALYIAGHSLAQLYIAQTGWQRPLETTSGTS
jgi:hypothetical protein